MAPHVGQFSGRLTIDLGAIQRNWSGIDRIAQTALTGAVVKADAYGTGLVATSAALWQAGARFFFVATPDEAEVLRNALGDAHIFVLNGLPPKSAEHYAAYRLMPVLNSFSELDQWLALCVRNGEALPAAIHFDTGMNRLGIRHDEVDRAKAMMDQAGYLPQLIMSHLACGDQPTNQKTRIQRSLFQDVMRRFGDIPASLANSAGTFLGRDNHFQIVRPGIALYGGKAVAGRPNPMAHVATLEMPILQVHDARLGETVGYGATQSLHRDSRLAVIGYGYADGYLRSQSGSDARPGAYMFIAGQRVPVVGRISMDLTIVDVTDLGDRVPPPGTLVEVMGPNIPVDDLADRAGTIPYEILTGLKGRFTRRYRDSDGAVFEG